MMDEMTRENMTDYFENIYDRMVITYTNPIFTEIQELIQSFKRDSSEYNMNIVVHRLYTISKLLFEQYSDEDLILEFRELVIRLGLLFDIDVTTEDNLDDISILE